MVARVSRFLIGACLVAALVAALASLSSIMSTTSCEGLSVADAVVCREQLHAIDEPAFRGLSLRMAWPWGHPSPSVGVGETLARRAQLSIDYAVIVVVTLLFALSLSGASLFRTTRHWLRGGGLVAIVAAVAAATAVLACVEYGNAIVPSVHGLGLWRIVRLSLMVVGAAGCVAIAGGALRATLALTGKPGADTEDGQPEPTGDDWVEQFTRRIHTEYREIQEARPAQPRVATARPRDPASDLRIPSARPSAGEPFVSFSAGDMTGLALSGGGIRSATFALGLLQGLNRAGLLDKFDYLSTVSGGGYIGSFWSAWLKRGRAPGASTEFPDDFESRRPRLDVESREVRHLREFGNFLAPRIGLFEVETWTAVVAILSGLIPAVLLALSLIGVTLIAWLVTTTPLTSDTASLTALVAALVTITVLVHFELLWQKVKLPALDGNETRSDARRADLWLNGIFGGVATGVVALLLLAPASLVTSAASGSGVRHVLGRIGTTLWPDAPTCPPVDPSTSVVVRRSDCWTAANGPHAWWTFAGLADRQALASSGESTRTAWFASPVLFTYPLVWFVTGVVLLGMRHVNALVPPGGGDAWVPPLDRVAMRLLGLGVFGAAVAVLWHVIVNLNQLLATTMLAITSAGGFALLRNWLARIGQTSGEPKKRSALKEALPQVLAWVTVLLAIAGVGQLLIKVCGTSWFSWWLAFGGMAFVLVGGLFIEPGRFGLHAFYRGRISRAYAGASNYVRGQSASHNRVTESKSDDDLELEDLPTRPLHLICCAANDLSGDAVGTLGRNARSAVLSRHGLQIGPFAGPTPGLTLGAAVTASAAAFNSNMGDLSARLGPAVTFLMTALNLRLGLWVRHPDAEPQQARRWPGLLLYREFFGLTSASEEWSGTPVPTHLRDLHLSDGGHFENLALYELVRRHCRYILVSDAGADPTIAFDDLGRAIRRIRQDFGIDISIDVDTLRPDARGLSKQHIAIGRIHYSPTDAGILLYVKPTLTGDEPADVLQYQRRNGDFPHEGTGDQFYDEAQWESYRRLGLHVADTVFGFVPPANEPASGVSDDPEPNTTDASATGDVDDRRRKGKQVTTDYVFAEAAHRWGPTPPGLEDRVLEMTRRVVDFEAELKTGDATALVLEVFPELHAITGVDATRADSRHAGLELVTILRITQLMEDVWTACALDEWWSHPLNMGWVNFFARWSTAPTFRFWWPFMGPMFGKGFRDFLDGRFPMPGPDGRTGRTSLPWQGIVRAAQAPVRGELARASQEVYDLARTWWEERSAQPCPWLSEMHQPDAYLEDVIARTRGGREVQVQVGLAAVWRREGAVFWTSDDFFVPPSLWGRASAGTSSTASSMFSAATRPSVSHTSPSSGGRPTMGTAWRWTTVARSSTSAGRSDSGSCLALGRTVSRKRHENSSRDAGSSPVPAAACRRAAGRSKRCLNSNSIRGWPAAARTRRKPLEEADGPDAAGATHASLLPVTGNVPAVASHAFSSACRCQPGLAADRRPVRARR